MSHTRKSRCHATHTHSLVTAPDTPSNTPVCSYLSNITYMKELMSINTHTFICDCPWHPVKCACMYILESCHVQERVSVMQNTHIHSWPSLIPHQIRLYMHIWVMSRTWKSKCHAKHTQSLVDTPDTPSNTPLCAYLKSCHVHACHVHERANVIQHKHIHSWPPLTSRQIHLYTRIWVMSHTRKSECHSTHTHSLVATPDTPVKTSVCILYVFIWVMSHTWKSECHVTRTPSLVGAPDCPYEPRTAYIWIYTWRESHVASYNYIHMGHEPHTFHLRHELHKHLSYEPHTSKSTQEQSNESTIIATYIWATNHIHMSHEPYTYEPRTTYIQYI